MYVYVCERERGRERESMSIPERMITSFIIYFILCKAQCQNFIHTLKYLYACLRDGKRDREHVCVFECMGEYIYMCVCVCVCG